MIDDSDDDDDDAMTMTMTMMPNLVRTVMPSQTRGRCSVSRSKAMMSNFQVVLSASKVRICANGN